jgi:Phycobilisome protein
MLQQLEHLSLSAEGRYATSEELQFMRNYLSSVDLRLSAYQKIRDEEKEIISLLQTKIRDRQPDIFMVNSNDVSQKCQRDCQIVLRNAIAAMLMDDLDRLREHILLWQRTIIKAFKEEHIAAMIYTNMPEVIKQFLTPQEFALLEPILQLNQAVLTT